MAVSVVPHLANDQGVEKIYVGVKEFQCMGARPPFDHPHVFLDMGADGQILCPYCSTLFVHDARLKPTKPIRPAAWPRRSSRPPEPYLKAHTMAADRPVLIAGGGIGGLALALALSQAGRSAIVLERRAEFETEGAGIQLGPNGVHVLRRLGIADALRAKVGEPEHIAVREGGSGRLARPAAAR